MSKHWKRATCSALWVLCLSLLVPCRTRGQVIKTAPPPGSFKLRNDLQGVHPRLHFTAAEIPAIRAKGKGGAAFFVDRMKAAYDGYKGGSVQVTGTGDWKNYLYGLWGQLAMSLLWIVEEDAVYADTAKSWALHYAQDDSWCATAEALDDLVPQEIVTGIALTYDILYDRLSASERQLIRAKLKTLLDMQYDRFFVGQYWTNDFQNNHMHNRISGLGHAAIAILGDDPAVDVQKHADLAHHAMQLTHAWMPDDGSTHEGPGYWDYGYHWIIRDEQLFAHTTGVTPSASGHDSEAPYYRVYTLAPGLMNTFRIGDSGDSGPAANLEAMLPAMARFKDEQLHSFVTQQMQDNPDGFYQQVAWGLLWYDPTVGTQPHADLPLGRVWPDLDMISVRSGWDADSVGLVFISGPPGGHLMQQKLEAGETDYINVAHDHPDQNSFLLWAHGEMLATDDGYPKDMKLTSAHNTLLIDGEGGPEEGTGWYQPFPYSQTAFLQQMTMSGATAYAAGDASRLYLHGERFIRHLAFVEGQHVMIIDDVKGEGSADHTFDWRIHSGGSWTEVSPSHFSLTVGSAGLDVRFLAPSEDALSSSFFAAASTANPGLSVTTTASETRFLTLLVPHQGSAPAMTAEQAQAQNGWAMRVTQGNTTDLFAVAASGQNTITVGEVTIDGAALLLRRDGEALELALLAGGTAMRDNSETILASDAPADLAWRPSSDGGRLEVSPPYKTEPAAGVEFSLQVGGLKAGTTYCVTVDDAPAGEVTTDAAGLAEVTVAAQVAHVVALKEAGTEECASPAPPGGPDAGASPGTDAGSGATDGGSGDAGSDTDKELSAGCCAVTSSASDGPVAMLGLLLLLGLLFAAGRRSPRRPR